MTDDEIHNIYLHTSGRADGIAEVTGSADFPVLFARAILEFNRMEREWVGLTDEEMRDLEKQFEAERVRTSDEEYLVIYPAAYWQWQRAIEAKLKEKNT